MIMKSLKLKNLTSKGLRTEAVSQAASKLSAFPDVRRELLNLQRNFANSPPNKKRGAVLDGRDIGTVVCPNAQIKLFITASLEVRAIRRLKELQNRGTKAIYARVLEEMIERDNRDQSREIAPLEPAIDSYLIDTSNVNKNEVFEKALVLINSATQT